MTTDNPRFDHLLSARARIGWGAPVGTQRPVSNALYEFGGGFPDPESFPYEGIAEATTRLMRSEDGPGAMNYGDPQGYRGLRELVVQKYDMFEGLKVAPENIIVANGSGHALSLMMSAFIDVGDSMICESPAFSGTLVTLRRHGPRILDVPVDDEGIVTSEVRRRLEQLRREGAPCKMIYTIVNFQNPTGPSQSLQRRHEMVELAHEFDTLILEDDAYGELRFEGETLPSLYALDQGRRVIRAGTLSKILGAGVRLGWLCCRRELIPAFQGFLFGGGVNPFMSRVATYYMRENMAKHVALLIDVYRAKRDAMLRGLWEVLKGTDVKINKPEGGFFVWIRLPSGTDPAKLSELAIRERVQYTPGANFYPNGGDQEFIRLAYSYESPDKCYEGSRLLGKAILAARK
ncbi:MAG: PLP-dependent aminotransferase family protein [Candidatus Rokubacteria bacterium]|nr:PLP-dependent aminotransferase family protein [Candidatus Rokubacteria bacterium]